MLEGEGEEGKGEERREGKIKREQGRTPQELKRKEDRKDAKSLLYRSNRKRK